MRVLIKMLLEQRKERKGMLKTWKNFLQEEEGMGTVEIILIIVEIFTGI